MGKYFKVSFPTKWKLGENVVLLLIECLTPSFHFDYLWITISHLFHISHLLTRLGVSNIRATRVPNKNRLPKCAIIGEKQLQKKKKRDHFE